LNLRPDSSTGNPGQTYIWYTGDAVYPFGYGLFYTTFETSTPMPNATMTADIGTIMSAAHPGFQYIDQVPIINFTVNVLNSGSTASEYSAMLFSSTQNAGPPPYPNKWLVGFDRLASIAPGASSMLTIPVSLGAMARIDELGNSWLYPGTYELALNHDASAVISFALTGNAIVLAKWPLEEQQIPPA
jgi:beta-D-xylosidase 4